MEEQKIPEGYKKTDVGVIPEDWDCINLGELGDIVRGGSPRPAGDPKYFNGDYIPWLTVASLTNIPNSQMEVTSTISKLTELGSRQSRTLNVGTLIISNSGATLGVAKILNIKCCANDGVAAIINQRKGDKLFIAHYINTQTKRLHDDVATGNGQPNLNTDLIRLIPIPFPKESEQTAIANALSDVDALIAELEKLIAKKQAIKTATMQQLLTGRTRLPEFANHPDGTPKGYRQTELGEIPEDWDNTLFEDVIDFCSSGATPFRGNKSFYKGDIRWITSGELNYCTIYDSLEKVSLDAVRKTNLRIHPSGTFLMAITGLEAAGTRGSCGIVGLPSTTNQSCMAIYPNKRLDSQYLYHWYVYNGEELAFKYCQGTKQLSYTAGIIKKIPFYLPREISEQVRIANILSDMDKEIQSLQQRLDKTRKIKQGMMQELLTGKTRLI